jgi:transposase
MVPALYMAIETGARKWKVGFSSGLGQRPRIRVMNTANLVQLREEIRLAKRRFDLPEDAPVYSCYEAGRDGFWIHRALERGGVHNEVVDSSSIQVDRRARRAKSDKLDVAGLVTLVIRRCRGEERVCRVCRPPSPEDEDRRQLGRELEAVKAEHTASVNRIKSFLAGQGVYLHERGLPGDLSKVRTWQGAELPAQLRSRLDREVELLRLSERRIAVLMDARKELMRSETDPAAVIARKLQQLRGIGPESSWLFAAELFAWRRFRNVRELAAIVGLAPTPHQSGTMHRELGISKAGNRRVRAMLIEIAWRWPDHQPQSALALWYKRKFASGSSVHRRKGIVALARKLLIALWKYVEFDTLPEGAVLKP